MIHVSSEYLISVPLDPSGTTLSASLEVYRKHLANSSNIQTEAHGNMKFTTLITHC